MTIKKKEKEKAKQFLSLYSKELKSYSRSCVSSHAAYDIHVRLVL